MHPRIITLSLLAMLGAHGCYAVEEPEQLDELLSLKREIESALPENASIVWKLSPREWPASIESVTWSMRDGGSLLVPYDRHTEKDRPTGLPLAVYVAPDGQVIPLDGDQNDEVFSLSSDVPPPSVTPCGDEAIIRICNADDSTLWVTDLTKGTLRRSEAMLGSCTSSVLGTALGEDRFVTIHQRQELPILTEWSCSGGELREASEPTLLPWMPALPRWVEKIEPSVYAWVRHQPGTGEIDFGDWVYERTDTSDAVRVPRTELPFPSDFDVKQSWERVRREASGALLVDGISGLYRWNVEADGQVEQLGKAPLPSPELSEWGYVGFGTAISSRVDWNPDGVQLEMPLEYEVLRATSEGYESVFVPSTPCVTREACRRIGESYLRGVVETGNGPLGLYVMWTWQLHPVPYGDATATGLDLATVILAPLDRPLP